jgi:hypothetical protein
MRQPSFRYLLISLSIVPAGLTAQTPASTINVAGPPPAAGLAANNPWMGAQVGYKFGNGGDFENSLLVTARLLYKIESPLPRLQLPVMGNISDIRPREVSETGETWGEVQSLLISAEGINLGIFPYFPLHSTDLLLLTLHGGTSWKVNAYGSPVGETEYLHQARISGGIELGVGRRADGRLPLTVSIAPVMSFFSADVYEGVFGERRRGLAHLEVTGIVPIGLGVGVLMEGLISSRSTSGFRAGIVLAAEAN